MATYGYGRVSRDSQTSENQKQLIEAQLGMPVDHWYEDHATSGTVKTSSRPLFSKMVAEAVTGDTLVFSRVDRIARYTSDVLVAVEEILARGIEVYILQIGKEPLSTQNGKMMLTLYAMFAENERLAIVERTKNGLARVKKEGRILGPRLRIHPQILREMCVLRKQRVTLDSLSATYQIDRNTISQNVKRFGSTLDEYETEWNVREAQYEASAKGKHL